MDSVVFLSAVRTAIGTFGGTLKDVSAIDLGTVAASAAIERSNVPADQVGLSVFGNVIQGEGRDPYLSRVVSVNAGVPKASPAMAVNRLCGSGLQAIVSASQSIMLGDAAVALAGGAESMSNGGMVIKGLRWGHKMGGTETVDLMQAALQDPFGHGAMGVTGENVAERYNVTREDQDNFALSSQFRAAAAIEADLFADQIVPVEIQTRKGTVIFDRDEHPRATTAEKLASLRTVFKKDGTVTAGNASGINDGAAALVLASEKHAQAYGLKPLARLLSYGHAGVEPDEMGVGPIPASRQALERAGLTPGDLSVVESNEAFAAQAVHVTRELGLDPAVVNPNGGAIALGHPVGATGAIIATKCIHELRRTGGRYGLVTMCIGGGQGIAIVVENCDAA